MISISIRGVEDADRKLGQLERDLDAAQDRTVRAAQIIVREKVVLRMSDPGGSDPFWGRRGGAGDTLAARTGQSRARITADPPSRSGITVTAQVTSPDAHVAAHEEGFFQARARIPTAAAQTAQGVDRYRGIGLRQIPGAFFFRSKAGNLWGAISQGRKLVLLFLYKSVTHRGRHVFAGARNDAEPEVALRARQEIELAVRAVNS